MSSLCPSAKGATILARLKKIGLPEIRPWEDFFSDFKPPKRWTRFADDRAERYTFISNREHLIYSVSVYVPFIPVPGQV